MKKSKRSEVIELRRTKLCIMDAEVDALAGEVLDLLSDPVSRHPEVRQLLEGLSAAHKEAVLTHRDM